ncbi:MAG: hypothetical protein IJ396_07315 [Oscillibacter sp.]|nr:hypothetical protein [Oscillibacter sp.]
MSKNPEKKSGKVNYVWVLAGGYLAYLGAQLLFGVPKSETPMVGLIGGLVFVVIGGLLMLREWKAYKYGLEHINDPETWSDEDAEDEALSEAEESLLPEPEEDGEDEV